jgi:hypothetical protein
MGKKDFLFNKWWWDNGLAIYGKTEASLLPYTIYTKINSMWLKDYLKLPKTWKTTRQYILHMGTGKDSVTKTLKSIKHWQMASLNKTLCSKETINRINRQPTEW